MQNDIGKGNYSDGLDTNIVHSNHNRFTMTSFSSASIQFNSDFHFNDTLQSFRFVTTLTRGISHLPFEKFIDVLQPNVWKYSSSILIFGAVSLSLIAATRKSGGKCRIILVIAICVY